MQTCFDVARPGSILKANVDIVREPTEIGELSVKCPVDQVELVMSERQGVEIDYCPKCRGVWLDRGELDKILDRAAEAEGSRSDAPRAGEPAYRGHDETYRRKKRHSWLSDLFD